MNTSQARSQPTNVGNLIGFGPQAVRQSKASYCRHRSKRRAWEKRIHEKHYGKLTDNHKKVLKALCDNMDAQGVGSPSLDTLLMSIRKNNDAMIHKNTLIKMLRELVELEILGKDAGPRRNIPRNQTPPKQYTLLNLNEPRDLNTTDVSKLFSFGETNTYMCDEDHDAQDVCQDLPKPKEKETKVTKSSRHIDADKVAKGDQDEIKAAAKAGGLSDKQTEYVLGEVEAAKGIQNWGGWLRTMIGRVKQGGWNMKKRKPRNGTMSNGYTNSSSLKVTRGYTETRREVLEQFQAHADEATGPELGYFEEMRAQLRKGKVS